MASRTCRLLLIIKLSLSIQALFGQHPVDSLKTLLRQHPQQDSIRLSRLTDLAYYFYSLQPDSGIIIAREAVALAGKLEYQPGLASAYNVLGINYWAKGEDSLAMGAYAETLKWHRSVDNRNGEARVLNNMALIHYNRAEYMKAIACHEEALAIFEEMGHEKGIYHTYNNIGVVYLAVNDYPNALQSFLDALRHAGDEESIAANALVNIGLVYKNEQDYPRAISNYERALAVYRKEGNAQGEANVLGNLGTVYDQMGKSGKAIDFFQQALQLNTHIGNPRRMASDLSNLGVTYKHQQRYAEAKTSLENAVAMYKQAQDKSNLAQTLVQLASLYKLKPPFRDLNKALTLELQALELAKAGESPEIQSSAWHALSESYEQLGMAVNALQAYKQYSALHDSVFNTEKGKELIRKTLQYDFEKKEMLLKARQEKQKNKLNLLAGGMLMLLLMAGLAYVLYKKKRDADEMRKEAELQARITETEMKALRAQMNPHFIFNSLNAIGQFMYVHDLAAAEHYLSRFAGVMRLILEHSEHREISLADDLKALTMYMDLEALRMRIPFSYQVHVDPRIDPENTLVPPLILQPIVENSIWHGLSGLGKAGEIMIDIRLDGDLLYCTVKDNGTGVQHKHKGTKQSLGFHITASRVAIANKDSNKASLVRLTEHEEGVSVEIKLPYIRQF